MVVKIGHARYDENGRAKGGQAGDQNGRELVLQNWYDQNWTSVFRAKDSKVAEKIAQAMEQACINHNIGYDQGQRTTLYEQVKAFNWDIAKVKTKCECDCSSLVSVCINAAGIPISKNMYTGNQKEVLQATNKFNVLTNSKYLKQPNYLKRGDILLCQGHTAVVVSCVKSFDIESAKSFSNAFSGTYESTTDLNVRYGAGINKNIILTIPKGTKVRCYGYFTNVLQTNWLFVKVIYKNANYTGFVSAKYLIKK